jgi:hypothetical protein
MKKKLLSFVMVFGFVLQSWGQDSIKIIKFDFKEKRFKNLTSLEKLKQGEFYQLQIDKINMNLYKVSIGKKDSIVESEVTFPTFDAIGLGSINDVLSSLNNSTFSAGKNNETDIDVINKEVVNKYVELLNNTHKLATLDNNTFQSAKNQELLIQRDSILQKLKENYTQFYQQQVVLNNKNKILNQIKLSNSTIEELAKNLKEHIEIINDSVIAQLDLVALTYKESIYEKPTKKESILETLQPQPIKNILVTTKNERKIIIAIQNSIKSVESEYKDFIDKNKINKDFMALFEKDEDIKNKHKLLLTNIEKLKTEAIDSAYSKISPTKIIKYVNSIIDLDNNKERSFISLPVQHNGDITKLSIYITPKKEEYGNQYQTELHFPQNKNFYVGIGTSFYYANFKNDVYSTKATIVNDSVTNYQIINEKNKKGEIGITTLIHFGYRPFLKKKELDILAFNLVAGPALSLSNTVKPRIAIGGGIAIGRKNMLSINGLYMGGYVDKKSKIYDTELTYGDKPDKITVSKLQEAFAISLGYIYKF